MTIFQAYGKTNRNLVEMRGVDPRTSRMLSERSTFWATPSLIAHHFAFILHRSLRIGRDVRDSEAFNPGLWTCFWTIANIVKLSIEDLICDDYIKSSMN